MKTWNLFLSFFWQTFFGGWRGFIENRIECESKRGEQNYKRPTRIGSENVQGKEWSSLRIPIFFQRLRISFFSFFGKVGECASPRVCECWWNGVESRFSPPQAGGRLALLASLRKNTLFILFYKAWRRASGGGKKWEEKSEIRYLTKLVGNVIDREINPWRDIQKITMGCNTIFCNFIQVIPRNQYEIRVVVTFFFWKA